MKLSQKFRIFSFLLNNADSTITEIANSLKIKAPSVRRAVFNLRKDALVTKKRFDKTIDIEISNNAIQLEDELRRLPLKTPEKIKVVKNKFIVNHVLYCQGVVTTYEAITYSEEFLNIPKLMREMADLIEDTTIDRCSPIRENSGIEIKKVIRMPFEYPEIRINARRGKFL